MEKLFPYKVAKKKKKGCKRKTKKKKIKEKIVAINFWK